MSARALAWAFLQISQGRAGTPSGALVILKLSDRADPEGRCWPGHERTAADLNLSPNSVKAAVRHLVGQGLIRIERQQIGGRDGPNVYHLNLNFGEGANSAPRGAKSDARGAKNSGFRGAEFAPESKDINKKREPEKRESARARAGGANFAVDGSGIHHNQADKRDQQTLQAIGRHPPEAVAAAAARAAARDDQGRAFPSAVLREILRSSPVATVARAATEVQVPRTTLSMDFSTKTYAREMI
ncbi:hypothetical protein THIX_60468 [Thiomonas sp. X19]|uniref:helix-turn-helix domain-containing protein n=1 Tax=Thiomonas sp. X19 TaxID=1050370 RepID=UPI000B6D2517|nr:helix-turn-helix domain-containing protein [Thiomonas sp. X19]SCC94410.1 hypothetical protein THIX_60468 [Thiomonas sp. X19]